MYQVSDSGAVLRGHRRLLSRRRTDARVSRTVVLLGLTSLLTDISSEMVVTVLPLYLVYVGGFSPLAFGLIDGIYNGATAIVRLASGFIGDRWQRHKEVAATGYGLSALCKLLLLTVGTAVSAIGAVVLLDRVGKGIRTAPRDAMISLSTPREHVSTAFGVHRAMDTTGALLGPIIAFALLAVAPLAFDSVFVVSLCLAVLGVGVLVAFVQPQTAAGEPGQPAAAPSLRRAFGLVRLPRYRALLLSGGALSVATASDAFVFLILQDRISLGMSLFPLLFVGSAATFMVLAIPVGRLADRIGRGRVLLGGYALLLGVYVTLLAPIGGWVPLVAALALLGGYYAATDGVLMAFGSAVVPDDVRGSGLALLGTVTSLGRFAASLLFGLLWTIWGTDAALAVFSVALIAAGAMTALMLARTRESGAAATRP
jgi:MFS family permease